MPQPLLEYKCFHNLERYPIQCARHAQRNSSNEKMSFEQIGQTGPKRSHAFYAAILILGALIVGTGTLPSTLMLSINPKIFKLQVAHPKHSEFVKQTAMQQNISQTNLKYQNVQSV